MSWKRFCKPARDRRGSTARATLCIHFKGHGLREGENGLWIPERRSRAEAGRLNPGDGSRQTHWVDTVRSHRWATWPIFFEIRRLSVIEAE
jgi:hypothetical protein